MPRPTSRADPGPRRYIAAGAAGWRCTAGGSAAKPSGACPRHSFCVSESMRGDSSPDRVRRSVGAGFGGAVMKDYGPQCFVTASVGPRRVSGSVASAGLPILEMGSAGGRKRLPVDGETATTCVVQIPFPPSPRLRHWQRAHQPNKRFGEPLGLCFSCIALWSKPDDDGLCWSDQAGRLSPWCQPYLRKTGIRSAQGRGRVWSQIGGRRRVAIVVSAQPGLHVSTCHLALHYSCPRTSATYSVRRFSAGVPSTTLRPLEGEDPGGGMRHATRGSSSGSLGDRRRGFGDPLATTGLAGPLSVDPESDAAISLRNIRRETDLRSGCRRGLSPGERLAHASAFVRD